MTNDSKTEINVGAFANFNFTKNIGVVSEFNYEQKGFQIPISTKFGIILDGRYNKGLMLLEPDKIYVEEYKNVSFNISGGLIYHLAF